MLTALDKTFDSILALPDFDDRGDFGPLRERTRQGELVCPTCREQLWLRAGEILIAHFAHRRLSDCPHGRVSEAILAARRLVYRFFQARIEGGKLPAEIQLEPVVPGLAREFRLDLMLRRQTRPWVAVVLLESSLQPEIRARLPVAVQQRKWIFRPVFLSNRLKSSEDIRGRHLLDPTQREFRLKSPYDLRPPGAWLGPGTLHFVNARAAQWTTLRGAALAHEPQVFTSRVVRTSPLDQLLWSEAHSEWVHPGEAEELKAFRAALEAKQREKERAAAERASALARARAKPGPASGSSTGRPVFPARAKPPQVQAPACPAPSPPVEPEPLPAWLSKGLVCVGCGKRTNDWQNADPGKDRCVCRKCFQAHVRLPA